MHTFRPGLLLTVSPFYHGNIANYDGGPNDVPVATTQHRNSQYAGAQIAFNAATPHHDASAGVYAFGRHDDEFVGIIANDGSGLSLAQARIRTGPTGGSVFGRSIPPFFLAQSDRGSAADSFLRRHFGERRRSAARRLATHSSSELGFAGFWGMYYQAPPLSTVTGPLADYAVSQGLGFIPLRGERDQEHPFRLAVPFKGWSLEVSDHHQRARNYFDHKRHRSVEYFLPFDHRSGAFVRLGGERALAADFQSRRGLSGVRIWPTPKGRARSQGG